MIPYMEKTTLPANLAQECEEPSPMKEGDNIPMVALDNLIKLVDCREKHKATVAACKL